MRLSLISSPYSQPARIRSFCYLFLKRHVLCFRSPISPRVCLLICLTNLFASSDTTRAGIGCFLLTLCPLKPAQCLEQSRYSITPWWINKEGLKFFLEHAGELTLCPTPKLWINFTSGPQVPPPCLSFTPSPPLLLHPTWSHTVWPSRWSNGLWPALEHSWNILE